MATEKKQVPTENDFGPPIRLATKEQLAEELTRRTDGIALVLYRGAAKDSAWRYDHNIPTKQTVPEILRELARFLDHCERDGAHFSESAPIG